MNVKVKLHQFNKMIKDVHPNKNQDGYYFHGHNIRFVSSDNIVSGGFHFEKGNKLVLKIPTPKILYTSNSIQYAVSNSIETIDNNAIIKNLVYNVNNVAPDLLSNTPRNELEKHYFRREAVTQNGYFKTSGKQIPLGFKETKNGIVLITTDNEGFDCVWLIDFENDIFDVNLLYVRNMGLSINYPIEILNNFENEKIDKIYWIDTIHQLRHLNLKQSIANGDKNKLIDMSVDLIEAVSAAELSQPTVTDINYGGIHTSGMIQYCYSLYKMNGSQTYASPTTQLIPLGKGFGSGGGKVNEIVGSVPVIKIDNIDTNYDNIIVYAIKYTSYLTEPQVSIIEDRAIPESGDIEIYDDGTIIRNSSLSEFKMINNSLNFPSSISSKDNSLFEANYIEKTFDVKIDTRAYQFSEKQTISTVYKNIMLNEDNVLIGDIRSITGSFTDDPEDTHDSINLFYDQRKFRYNSNVIGGDGKYLYFSIKKINNNIEGRGKYFKDGEIYRLGIVFYNIFGQQTLPKWVCDFKAPIGNLKGRFNSLEFGLKGSFITKIDSMNLNEYNKPIGYKVLVAKRTNADKTVLNSGLINPMMISNNIPLDNVYNEAYNNGKLVRIKNSKLDELDQKLRVFPKSPNPLFRNSWLDFNNLGHETLLDFHIVANRFKGLKTMILDSPLQKSSHYRFLNNVLIEGALNNGPQYLTEFPTGFKKKNFFFNFQDTKIMQMYSPEAIFDTVPTLPENCSLEVRYAFKNVENHMWERVVNLDNKNVFLEFKLKNRLSAQVNYEENDNINSVEYTLGSPGRFEAMLFDPSGTYWAITNEGGYPAGNPYIDNTFTFFAGWGGRGVFGNYWADNFGGTEKFVPLNLYYRKYGYSLSDLNNKVLLSTPVTGDNVILPHPIGGINVDWLSPILVGPISGLNIGSLKNSLVNADKLKIKSKIEITNIKTDSALITLTSGLDIKSTSRYMVDNTSNNFITKETIIDIDSDELDLNPTLYTGVSLNKYNNESTMVQGNINVTNTFEVMDSSNSIIEIHELIQSTSFTNDFVNIFNLTLNDIIDVTPGSGAVLSYKIYKRPIHTKKGASSTEYNGDGYFKFNNTLKGIGANDLGGNNNSVDKTIRSINANHVECVTFVLNPSSEDDNKNAIAHEKVISNANFNIAGSYKRNTGAIYCDIVRSKNDIYLSGIYGGNSYEDKKRTVYLEVGDYKTISTQPNRIESPGDTFVQDFRFLRISRGDVNNLTTNITEHEEIVEYLTETTVDLLNRSDSSFTNWDSEFSYEEPNYHNYNRVYSQPNLITSTRNLDYNFKEVSHFSNTIRGSKKKTNGESVDSWLQPLVNETLDLDGKYGSINRLLNFSDNIVALQDTGVSLLSINPKVQITDTSGVELNLGTGKLLDGYKYIATGTGSLKWSCITTPVGIFYVDSRQNSLNHITDNVVDISRLNGFKNYTIENVIYDKFKNDNPLLGDGISLGYDPIRTDVYFTFAKDSSYETLVYNISQESFSSFYDYNSSMYIPYKERFFTFKPDNHNLMYESFKGPVGNFYGENKESYIEFISNPEPLVECEFNNLEFKDECADENEIEKMETFDTIEVTNEFQDSGEVQLKPKFNLRKLNRKWRVSIPRSNKVNRMRNTWVKIRLKSNNENNYEHRVDDIAVFYRPNNKTFN